MRLDQTFERPLLKYLSFRLEDVSGFSPRAARIQPLGALVLVLVAVGGLPLLERTLLPDVSFIIDTAKHANLEIFCGLMSLIIGFILFGEYTASGRPRAFYLVMAFLSMGFLDIFHAVSESDHNMFVWFHTSSAFFGAVFLFVAVMSPVGPERGNESFWIRRLHGVLGLGCIFLFAWFSIRLDAWLPNVLALEMPVGTSVSQATGTFSRLIYGLNVTSGFLYAVAGVFFVIGFYATTDVVFHIFAASCLLFAESEILFAFSQLWDPIWWYWHVVKGIVFSGLLVGLAWGFTQTSRKLYASRKDLSVLLGKVEEKNRQLRQAYERLKETKKYLAESEKLATVGKMAASLAHEIRNPLGAISNSIGIFRRHSSLDEDGRELVGIIDDEIDRLNKLVEDFILYAKPLRVKRERLSVCPLIADALTMFSFSEGVGTRIRVENRCEPTLPEIRGDAHRIKQALLNLLSNALQAIPGSGVIRVTARNKGEEGEIEIVVADSGPGIGEEIIPKIFEPFFSTKDQGMGLGLNIVQNIMKAHGGYLMISSQPKQGTAIHLRFPVFVPADHQSESTDLPVAKLAGAEGS